MTEIEYSLKERGKILDEMLKLLKEMIFLPWWRFLKYKKLRKELDVLFDKFDNYEPRQNP